jgi:hypothetical protein
MALIEIPDLFDINVINKEYKYEDEDIDEILYNPTELLSKELPETPKEIAEKMILTHFREKMIRDNTELERKFNLIGDTIKKINRVNTQILNHEDHQKKVLPSVPLSPLIDRTQFTPITTIKYFRPKIQISTELPGLPALEEVQKTELQENFPTAFSSYERKYAKQQNKRLLKDY